MLNTLKHNWDNSIWCIEDAFTDGRVLVGYRTRHWRLVMTVWWSLRDLMKASYDRLRYYRWDVE